jgi:hypothetical protein
LVGALRGAALETEIILGLFGATGVVATLVGGAIVRDRQISRMISEGDQLVRHETHEGFKDLHERVNGVRENYVRRDDLDGHLTRLSEEMRGMRDEMRATQGQTNQRLDNLLTHLTKNTPGS